MKREVEYGTPEQNEAVTRIIDGRCEQEGDAALRRYARAVRRRRTSAELRVSDEEIQAAYAQVDAAFVAALRQAAANIRAFHEKQKRNSWMDLQPDGSMLGQIIRPLKRVGIVCARRQGGLSVLGADERDPGAGRGGAGDRDGDAAFDRGRRRH